MSRLLELLKIKYPIIQAPMAGGMTTTSLVSAVSNGGGLGNIGAGYMTANDLRVQIRDVKATTANPFGINLFVPEHVQYNESLADDSFTYMKPFRKQLELKEEVVRHYDSNFEDQLQVILEEGASVCSFTFGLPNKGVIEALHQNGTVVIGTATTVVEAQEIERLGLDAIVVQGSEAGGHRGNFLHQTDHSLIGLMSLVPQVADNVTIPVIAAGGIMDGRGVSAAMCLGAQGAQMGTAFLTCTESGANEVYKKAVLEANEDELILTKAFSGKFARGINNYFIEQMNLYDKELPPYPIQNTLTKGLRKEAGKQSNSDFMSLWSGQSPRLSRAISAQQLIEQVMDEMNNILM
ncbi:NAD(P)H-dependent flavin oxidoreductase [Bacillus solimangrovi]|uniref:Probable nitronate monooxygenase n=1 Tax=Bacillus solimangrovi TaxID=1305675 RepID=A0A1E5LES8_9BACI|nr:nitronate monooxygenase [Bacillus solimangrovi]OEH92583.1 nitronate monooxygenase [Bacillus solimangrovi]